MSSSQVYLQSHYPELYAMTSTLGLPPNALRILAQGQASGRLAVPLLNRAGRHAGNAKLPVVGSFTEVQTHPQQAILKSVSVSAYARGAPATEPVTQLQGATSQKSKRAKGRARRAARVGKSRTKTAVSMASRGPERTTPPWSGRTQSAMLPNTHTSTTHASPSQGDSTTPVTHVGASSEALPAVRPFPWATATSKQISRLPGLQSIPVKLLDVVLPKLRMFLEGYDDNIHSDAPAACHERDPLPAIAQPVESLLPTTQPRPSSLTEQFETAFPMAEQNYELGAFNGWEEFMRL